MTAAARSQEPTAGPSLEGVRVLEVGHIIGGPFCGHLFADHGAEVIKIEPPGVGDPMRRWGHLHGGVGLYWSIIGRGKRSVELDLRPPDGQAMFRKLAATADVVVENLRPGTLERWNIGWDVLQEVNPRLIMIRISGYGQTGPYRDRAGFGAIAEAMSGFRHLSGEPGRPPVRVGISIGDAMAGTQGFVGGLLALYHRDRPGGPGRGQVVDVALYEAMWMYMESLVAEHQILGVDRGPTGSILPGVAPSNVYPTADHEWVLIAANQDTVFSRLSHAIGRPDWVAEDSPYRTHEGRGERQTELDELLAGWTLEHPTATILDVMADAGVPAGRIYTARDIAGDPHYRAREMIIDVATPGIEGTKVPMPGVVPKLSASPGRVARGAPLLGEDTDGVILELLEADRCRAASRTA